MILINLILKLLTIYDLSNRIKSKYLIIILQNYLF